MMHKIKSSHENLRGRPGTLKMCSYPASFQSGLGEEKHQNIRAWTIEEHGWNATIVFHKIQKNQGDTNVTALTSKVVEETWMCCPVTFTSYSQVAL